MWPWGVEEPQPTIEHTKTQNIIKNTRILTMTQIYTN